MNKKKKQTIATANANYIITCITRLFFFSFLFVRLFLYRIGAVYGVILYRTIQ